MRRTKIEIFLKYFCRFILASIFPAILVIMLEKNSVPGFMNGVNYHLAALIIGYFLEIAVALAMIIIFLVVAFALD